MYIRLRQMFGIPANVHSVDRETLEVQKDTFRPENERRGNERPRRRPQGVEHEVEGGGERGRGKMWKNAGLRFCKLIQSLFLLTMKTLTIIFLQYSSI